MPPRPPIANTARLNIALSASAEVGGHVAQNVMYVIQTGAVVPWTASNLATLAGQIRTAWGTNVAPHVSTEWQADSWTLTAVDGTEEQGAASTPIVGSLTSSLPLPPQVAACVSWPISAAYRGGKPRTYHVGLDMAQLSAVGSNLLTTTAAGNIATGWGAFMIAVNALTIGSTGIQLGTVSYRTGNTPRVTPLFRNFSINPKVNTRLASQRKRSGKLSVGAYEV